MLITYFPPCICARRPVMLDYPLYGKPAKIVGSRPAVAHDIMELRECGHGREGRGYRIQNGPCCS
jgi:hypothetical protein